MVKKKTLLILLSIAIILIVAVLVVLFLVFKKPSSISDCKNLKCVKTYAAAKNFIPQNCEKAPENFRNDCYYTYELGNMKTQKIAIGMYCNLIKDENFKAECLYETAGEVFITKDIKRIIKQAILSSDINNCDKINTDDFKLKEGLKEKLKEELKKECVNAIPFSQKAIKEKNMSLCFNTADALYSYQASQICGAILDELLYSVKPNK